jgi:hypothetical protein
LAEALEITVGAIRNNTLVGFVYVPFEVHAPSETDGSLKIACALYKEGQLVGVEVAFASMTNGYGFGEAIGHGYQADSAKCQRGH